MKHLKTNHRKDDLLEMENGNVLQGIRRERGQHH